jgi:hypothetical protein
MKLIGKILRDPPPRSSSRAARPVASKNYKTRTHDLTSDATTIDALDGRINDLTARRNAIASDMIAMLEAAEFQNKPVDRDEAWELIERARELLGSLH